MRRSNGCTGPLRSARLDRASTNLADPTLRETLTASPRVEVCDARIESRRVIVPLVKSRTIPRRSNPSMLAATNAGPATLAYLSYETLARVTIGQKHGRGTKPTCNGVLTI